MKLYMHPVSTTSRAVLLCVHDNKLPVEEKIVDLMTGEHYKEPYVGMNPNHMVPMLEDGDFRLTESATINRYLAGKFELTSLYPTDLRKRARIDEMLDWFNTQFNRDYAYGLNYPQIFPHHKRPTPEFHEGVLAWGKERAEDWLTILDKHWIGAGKQFLVGDKSIADYTGAALISLGETIRCDLTKYPNVDRWMGNMKKLECWNRVHETFHGFVSYLKDQQFKAI